MPYRIQDEYRPSPLGGHLGIDPLAELPGSEED